MKGVEPWEPLEGTPEAFNTLAKGLGVDTRRWCFVYVLGLDDDLLASVQPGAVSLILLYPTVTEAEEYLRRKVPSSPSPSDVFFARQTVGGTCGTIAVMHALVNSIDDLGEAVAPDSVLLSDFMDDKQHDSLDKDDVVERRSQRLLDSEVIRKAHQAAYETAAGSNKTPAAGQRQGRHFITFVHMDGSLVELDGRRTAPACRGATCASTFLHDAAAEVRSIVAAVEDPLHQLQFSLFALVPINL